MNKIYVLHENGAPTHYQGLEFFGKQNDYRVFYKEFHLLKPLLKAIFTLHFSLLIKCFANLFFLLSLFLTRRKNIVLGMAPFNKNIWWLGYLAKKHKFFYHTSWVNWEGNSVPHSSKILKAHFLTKKKWKFFLENDCKGVFCVTRKAEQQLKKYYDLKAKVSVVYHTVDQRLEAPLNIKNHKPLKVLFIGRIVEEKGIDEILSLVENPKLRNKFFFGIVGSGLFLRDKINFLDETKDNFTYHGRVEKKNLGTILKSYDILMCPSKKIKNSVWEELFGMSIIEAMALGLIPIATNHSGPLEIINDGKNGFIVEDNSHLKQNLVNLLLDIASYTDSKIINLKEKSHERGNDFLIEKTASRWSMIMESFI